MLFSTRTRFSLLTAFLAAFLALFPGPSTWGGGSAERTDSRAGQRPPSGSSAPEGNPEAPAFPLTLVDDAGVEVTLPQAPQRIISLTSFTDDIVLDLVHDDRLIGVTAYSTDPAISNVVAQAARVPNKLLENVERILSLQPDLLLVANWTDAADVAQLRACGVTVFLLHTPVTITGIEATILRVARLVGEPERGAAMVASMNRRLSAVAAKVAAVPAGQRVIVMDYTVWGSAQGRGSTWDEVVRRAGLVNAAGRLAADEWGQVTLSREKLLAMDPQLLVLPGWVYGKPEGASDFFRSITRDPALQGLRAVREGRVCQMPEGLRQAASQYVVDAVEYLARVAYPQLWAD